VGTITGLPGIIAFRNILVHGYAQVQDQLVWGVFDEDLPRLVREVEALIARAEAVPEDPTP
jgi:uncharacterized protein YutE (UPF0331/DUF86 family)